MKRFRGIIQDIKAPSTSGLWINNGELKYYTSNGSSDVYVLPGNLQTTEGCATVTIVVIMRMALLMEGALLQLRSNPQVSTL